MTALVIQGRIVTMADGATTEPFDGRVWMRGDRIEAVTQGGAVHPGFEGVPIVDVGASLVMPGFIDMHNHLAYAAQPLWSEPGRTEPWLHNKHWPGADTGCPLARRGPRVGSTSRSGPDWDEIHQKDPRH